MFGPYFAAKAGALAGVIGEPYGSADVSVGGRLPRSVAAKGDDGLFHPTSHARYG